MIGLLFIILPFASIGGLMAFLIQYEEMRHHHPNKAVAVRFALGTAIVAFVVLTVASLGIGLLISALR